MSNYLPEAERAAIRPNVLHAAARMFLEEGYAHSTTREIANRAGVNVSTMNRYFGAKENILCELVDYVLEGQMKSAYAAIAGQTEDPVLYYAVETVLQLYMAEHSEPVRELYSVSYSLPHSSERIHRIVAEQLTSKVFAAYFPDFTQEEFYEMEIASGGIIRGFLVEHCSELFPMEHKVQRFLETALRVYRVPEEKIREALEYVKQFDFQTLAAQTIEGMLNSLEMPQIEKPKKKRRKRK